MDISTLTAYAMIKVSYDQKKDHLENFMPFALEAITNLDANKITRKDVQKEIKRLYSIKIPRFVIGTLLKRAKKQKFIDLIDGIQVKYQEKLLSLNIENLRKLAQTENDVLIKSIQNFSVKEYDTKLSLTEIQDTLKNFIEKYGLFILRASIRGENIGNTLEIAARSKHIIADFTLKSYVEESDDFERIERLVQGWMLYNATFLPNIQEVSANFKGTMFFFDTSFIIRLLGFEGARNALPNRELLDILYTQNAKLKVFDFTSDEIVRVLYAVKDSMTSLSPREFAKRGLMAQYALSHNWKPGDILSVISRLKSTLRTYRIEVYASPPRVPLYTLDENLISSIIKDDAERHREMKGYPAPKEETIKHDVDSIAGIFTLRKGRHTTRIEDSPAIFVTTSSHLARVCERAGIVHPGTDAPISIADYNLAILAWIKNPSGTQSLPSLRLASDSYAVLQPDEKTWQEFLNEVDILISKNQVSEEELALLVGYTGTAEIVADISRFHSPEEFENSVFEVLNRVKTKIREEFKDSIIEDVKGEVEASTKMKVESQYLEKLSRLHEFKDKSDKMEAKIRRWGVFISTQIGRIVNSIFLALLLVFSLYIGRFITGNYVTELADTILSWIAGAAVLFSLITSFTGKGIIRIIKYIDIKLQTYIIKAMLR